MKIGDMTPNEIIPYLWMILMLFATPFIMVIVYVLLIEIFLTLKRIFRRG